jgi:hypothetical protein
VRRHGNLAIIVLQYERFEYLRSQIAEARSWMRRDFQHDEECWCKHRRDTNSARVSAFNGFSECHRMKKYEDQDRLTKSHIRLGYCHGACGLRNPAMT